ncbi:hypothetical protein NHX12_014486 [Muraenolepis orangiensis]|uniref:Gastrin/cholecystokinin type B receptor n=1 Tax=Muraenolepis orangiensis TaxID=630683 RepID=A0A9Q0DDV1_9TELE|nr:hypothetical protein NHX12_014486 [Muraenolepis orangiensis]
MELTTLQDLLVNSTGDLREILCSFRIGNLSKCDRETHPEPTETVRIVLYSLIFLLSILGNSLIIAVLLRNRQMRTVTNLFLLSLAASDLMLSLVCVPFTLIPNLMRNFVFGAGVCKMAMYFMGVSVSVSTFNLMAISLERYSAICNPLRSRSWQTKSHAARVISATWAASLVLMLPYPVASDLKPFLQLDNTTGHMCRLVWPNAAIQQSWYLSLLLLLFLIPGIVMMTAYGLISLELYRGIKFEMTNRKSSRERQSSTGSIKPRDSDGCYLEPSKRRSLLSAAGGGAGSRKAKLQRVCTRGSAGGSTANLVAKKRVIRMLLVIVCLFFLCWTPVFAVNAWQAFDQISANRLTGAPISYIHLLSYTSACLNPIIYCFMNKRFRRAVLATFSCCRRGGGEWGGGGGGGGGVGGRLGNGTLRGGGGKGVTPNGLTPPSAATVRFTDASVRAPES